jgi:orotidine-5'-phosphate decarboxylase
MHKMNDVTQHRTPIDSTRIMVALDVPNASALQPLLAQLKGIELTMKVGMELFYGEGPALIEQLKAEGHRIFLDLKLHDIPNTVRAASRNIAKLGVDVYNVHAAGGLQMMQFAREGLEQGWNGHGKRPQLIAVTQLTSTNQHTMNEQIGIPGTIESCVVNYAQLAKQAGLDGVVWNF